MNLREEMKILLLPILGIACFFLTLTKLQAQGVTQVRAELDKINRRVHVYYNLLTKGGKFDKYEVDLLLSQDSGKTFNDRLELVGGNVGRGVAPGIDKKIEWYYTKELPSFDGQGVAFKVVASLDMNARQQRILGLKGPESAVFSLLFPGWGDHKVRSGKNFWWIGTAAYTLAGGGLYLRLKSEENFDIYRAATTINEADESFDRADNQRQWGNYLLITAGSIWLTDLTAVVIKGIKNRKEQRRINAENAVARIHLDYDINSQTPLLGLQYRW